MPYRRMNPLQDYQALSLIAFTFLVILLAYTIINFRESNRILSRYSHVIRETMNNPTVKEFIESHRNVKVQIEETHPVIKVYWVTRTRYPYVIAEYDEETRTVTRVQLIDSNEESSQKSSD
ncbi:MAG: hypothetical protein GSR83_04670 [Desulfurococcales archaeon]|nr:hypothetical protein [Desulfurococcales archaeon]